MTREEWITRAALRYQEAAGLDEDSASTAAEALYESSDDIDFNKPEDSADEDISNWENDGD